MRCGWRARGGRVEGGLHPGGASLRLFRFAAPPQVRNNTAKLDWSVRPRDPAEDETRRVGRSARPLASLCPSRQLYYACARCCAALTSLQLSTRPPPIPPHPPRLARSASSRSSRHQRVALVLAYGLRQPVQHRQPPAAQPSASMSARESACSHSSYFALLVVRPHLVPALSCPR